MRERKRRLGEREIMSSGGGSAYQNRHHHHHQCHYQTPSPSSSPVYRPGTTTGTRARSSISTRKSVDSAISNGGSCINTSNPYYKSTNATSPTRHVSPRKPVAAVSPIANSRRRLPTSGSSSTSVYSTSYSSIRRRPPSFVLFQIFFFL